MAEETTPLTKTTLLFSAGSFSSSGSGLTSIEEGDEGISGEYNNENTDYPNQIECLKPVELPKSKPKSTIWKKHAFMRRIDKSALFFAIRMATLLTISALFVLVPINKRYFPSGMWVLVSVLFVSWFPSLDAASVIEKIIQRLIGTFVGAFLGLSCGFTSLLFFNSRNSQAVFLAVCTFIFTFGIIFFAGQCKVGRVKVIRRFAYATILCVLTFCICVLPFGLDENPKWLRATWRVINVVVGCIIGAIGSITVFPTSTTDVLYQKAARQVQMAGTASEAVLHMAANFFAGRIRVNRLADELLQTPLESELRWKLLRSGDNSFCSEASTENSGATDVALKKYEDAIADWKTSKALFPLTKYDPFRLNMENDDIAMAFHTEIARTLARTLRIQTTIVVIDGMVRSDADYSFTQGQLSSFIETGSLIKNMLKLPLDQSRSKLAAKHLFEKLEETRLDIVKVSASVSGESELEDERYESLEDFKSNLFGGYQESIRTEDDMGRGIPKNATGQSDNTLFFLQLVEHLILRSLRLYQAWQHVETIRQN